MPVLCEFYDEARLQRAQDSSDVRYGEGENCSSSDEWHLRKAPEIFKHGSEAGSYVSVASICVILERSTMDVILLKEVPHLGEAGVIVKVKNGYGRNYLIPRRLALQATSANKKAFEHEKRKLLRNLEREKAGAMELAKKLEGISLTLQAAVGEQDKMYGSITAHHVQEALQTRGIEVDRRRVLVEEPIRALGEYAVSVKLHSEVVVTVKISVVSKS